MAGLLAHSDVDPRDEQAVRDVELKYQMARLVWRQRLSDTDVRALAYEYKVLQSKIKHGANIVDDECLLDAWHEYIDRFGESATGPQVPYRKKAKGLQRSSRK